MQIKQSTKCSLLLLLLLLLLLIITSQRSNSTVYGNYKQLIEKNQSSPKSSTNKQDSTSDSNQEIDKPEEKEKNRSQTKEKNTPSQPKDLLILVNKEESLRPDYKPQNLVVPQIPFSFTEELPKRKLRKVAATAIEGLFKAAQADNIKLTAVSGYRSYQRQKEIFDYKAKRRGAKVANQTIAHPGHSEHQTGLAIDVSSPTVNDRLVREFGKTKAGRWLAKKAPQFGFIIRYPQDKTQITKYQYEPWHLRYVGPKHAQKISENNLTLEEYLNSLNSEDK
ncbi:MAG: M15 family metallopeptidase [Bacillota bacterium]